MTQLLAAHPGGEGRTEGSHSENGFRFYVGLHQPADCAHLDLAMLSVNRLCRRDPATGRFSRRPDGSLKIRQAPIPGAGRLLIDAGAFTQLRDHGGYPDPPAIYAEIIRAILQLAPGRVDAVVAEDFMCEDFIFAQVLRHTGERRTIADHQRMTIERYDALRAELAGEGVHVMPVLQGYHPRDYVAHLRQYGGRLTPGMWVGVGSVCKRNAEPGAILAVLEAIHGKRPDLRLHGFGLKKTALSRQYIRDLLYSSDSLAWSLNARKNGRNPNDWREAHAYAERITGRDVRPLEVLWKIFP